MSVKMNRILEYEKQLIQDRQQLLELLSETPEENEELVRYKLECFQKEIAFMNRQVELLKEEANTVQATQNVQRVGTFAEQMKQTSQAEMSPMQTDSETEAVSKAQAVQATQETQATNSAQGNQKQTAAKGAFSGQESGGQRETQATILQRMAATQAKAPVKKDLEQTVGKSLMGIFASVLIFISLILFATLLLPYFTDTLKMLTTYLVSFAFLAVGLVKMKKDKGNKFYIALTGCGIGAIYISLLLSNMYFKMLGDIPLYVLICIWGVGVCLFAKQQSKLFQIIGELGITVAMLFGSIMCIENEDSAKYVALIIFYIISSGVFYGVHFKKEFVDNLIHQVFHVINVFLLAEVCLELLYGRDYQNGMCWVILAIIAISLASTLWHSQEKDGISPGVFAAIYVWMGFGMMQTIFIRVLSTDLIYGVVGWTVAVALLAVFEWKKTKGNIGKYLVMAVLIFMAGDALNYHTELYDFGMIFLLIIPLMVAGFLRRNKLFQYGSLVLLSIYTFEYNIKYDEEWMHFLLEILPIITGFVLLWWKKEQYSAVFKYALHVIALVFIYNTTDTAIFHLLPIKYRSGFNDIPDICCYVLFTLYNIAMMKSVFGKNLKTGEKEKPVVYNIVNMFAMIAGIFMIADSGDGFWHMLLILTVLCAFFVNAKNLLEKRENLLTGIYVGIKFTILMIVILDSFYAENYVISIACLLMAVGCILLGFMAEYKSLRVFGLLLSMISIFKLIMVDISYDNTLGHAMSFFVSGILCFVISLIYNYIDKKFEERA